MTYLSTKDPIGNPITEDQLRAFVPSLFADQAHESRSARLFESSAAAQAGAPWWARALRRR